MHVCVSLQRKLVLPKFICYCDQDYYINVLANCTIDGADTAVPFVCPMDLFMIPDNIQASRTCMPTDQAALEQMLRCLWTSALRCTVCCFKWPVARPGLSCGLLACAPHS